MEVVFSMGLVALVIAAGTYFSTDLIKKQGTGFHQSSIDNELTTAVQAARNTGLVRDRLGALSPALVECLRGRGSNCQAQATALSTEVKADLKKALFGSVRSSQDAVRNRTKFTKDVFATWVCPSPSRCDGLSLKLSVTPQLKENASELRLKTRTTEILVEGQLLVDTAQFAFRCFASDRASPNYGVPVGVDVISRSVAGDNCEEFAVVNCSDTMAKNTAGACFLVQKKTCPKGYRTLAGFQTQRGCL